MTKQQQFHGYLDGVYQGIVIATEAQLAEMGMKAGGAPKVDLVAIARANSSIERDAFCNGLADLGIVKDAEAVSAARGEWPKSMEAFLEYLDAKQARDAQIEWAACVTVRRMHPFVLSLASWLGMKDEQVDALFGIA